MKNLLTIKVDANNANELESIDYGQLYTIFPSVVIERLLDEDYYKKYPSVFVFLNKKNDEYSIWVSRPWIRLHNCSGIFHLFHNIL